MKKWKFTWIIAILFIMCSAGVTFGEDAYKLRMVSYTNKGLKEFWAQHERLVDTIQKISNNKISITLE